MSGLGTFTFVNGDKYQGSWENDFPTGIHTVTYTDGTTGKARADTNGPSLNFVKITREPSSKGLLFTKFFLIVFILYIFLYIYDWLRAHEMIN
jgi:hypothetical protein